MNNEFLLKLQDRIKPESILVNEPMLKHTTFRIGGPADYFVTPTCIEDLQNVITLCRDENMPFYVIGNGSNLLVGDYGYRGVIVQINGNFSKVTIEKQSEVSYIIHAGAGILLSKLAMTIAEANLSGFEFASGIPGTLGGAVTMNAGAYGGEIKDCIVSATVMDHEGNVKVLDKEELMLGYRTSIIQKEAYIVLEASFAFQIGVKEVIMEQIDDLTHRRKEKQPLELPSAGSTFKRPEGYFAGKLIMDSGLRGYRVGDIMISEKHCGFVVNVGNGTAKQVRTLIEDVDRIVYEKFHVHLSPEVRFLGEF